MGQYVYFKSRLEVCKGEENTERIKNTLLDISGKGDAGKNIRVPERRGAALHGPAEKFLPRVELGVNIPDKKKLPT
jgi:hypothetical protein